MKKILLIVAGICGAMTLLAQTDSTKKVTTDSLRVGRMVIVRGGDDHTTITIEPEKKSHHTIIRKKRSRSNTNWWILDIGLNQFNDKTNYAAASVQNVSTGIAPGSTKDWFSLQNNKSINVNFWFFAQRQSIIKNVVNLKYGMLLELNNYRFERPVVFNTNPTTAVMIPPVLNTFSKNKLVANYITVPMMLNFNFAPDKKHGLALSGGVSAGYLYSSYQKTISGANGKHKTRNSFDLEPWKISYVGELQMGPIRLYGTMSTKSMFKRGLDWQPYSIGFRFSNW